MTRKLSYAFAIVLAGTVISLFLPYAEWVGSAPSFTVTICLYDSSNDSIIPARPEYFSVHGTEPEKVVIHVLSETLAEITVPESCAGGTMSFFGTSYRAGPQIIIGVPGYKVRVVKYYHDLNQYKSTVFGRVVELAPG